MQTAIEAALREKTRRKVAFGKISEGSAQIASKNPEGDELSRHHFRTRHLGLVVVSMSTRFEKVIANAIKM